MYQTATTTAPVSTLLFMSASLAQEND